jgi:hypothetical protein
LAKPVAWLLVLTGFALTLIALGAVSDPAVAFIMVAVYQAVVYLGLRQLRLRSRTPESLGKFFKGGRDEFGCEVEVLCGGVLTGRDFGVVAFDGDLIRFEGFRSRFALGPQDVASKRSNELWDTIDLFLKGNDELWTMRLTPYFQPRKTARSLALAWTSFTKKVAAREIAYRDRYLPPMVSSRHARLTLLFSGIVWLLVGLTLFSALFALLVWVRRDLAHRWTEAFYVLGFPFASAFKRCGRCFKAFRHLRSRTSSTAPSIDPSLGAAVAE